MTIASGGSISNSTIDSFQFEGDTCVEPDIIQVGSDMFAIAYKGPGSQGGQAVCIQIDASGMITNSVIDRLTFDSSGGSGGGSRFFHVAGDVYAVAYQDSDDSGQLVTLTVDGSGSIGPFGGRPNGIQCR